MDVSNGRRWETILTPMKQRSQLGKRLFDLALTLPVLVLLSPLITVDSRTRADPRPTQR